MVKSGEFTLFRNRFLPFINRDGCQANYQYLFQLCDHFEIVTYIGIEAS